MAAGDDFLTPWYAPGKTYDYGQEKYSRHFEEFFGEKKPVQKPVKKKMEPTPYAEAKPVIETRVITDQHTPDFMGSASNVRSLARAELTAAARRALRGEASFSMRNEAMQPPCSAWFVEAKKNGLRDVTLVFSFLFKDSKAVLGQEFAAVICSYMNGKTTRVILDYSNEKGFFVDEQPVTLDSWKKPAFPDPVVGLRKALLDIASVARMGTPTDWWANMFMNAAYRLDSKNCEYDKQPGLFYLPQPYFKYLMVVQETHLGMGMGSWYDLPIVGEKQFRLATHEFEYQKCRALLYAVNNF